MGASKLEKQKQKLIELGVMEPEDTLVDFLQASYVERLVGKLGKWKQGWAYFTESRVIVITGMLEDNIVSPYKTIRELGECSQSLMPIGITITHEDPETGNQITDRISLMKRDKWLNFMAEKPVWKRRNSAANFSQQRIQSKIQKPCRVSGFFMLKVIAERLE